MGKIYAESITNEAINQLSIPRGNRRRRYSGSGGGCLRIPEPLPVDRIRYGDPAVVHERTFQQGGAATTLGRRQSLLVPAEPDRAARIRTTRTLFRPDRQSRRRRIRRRPDAAFVAPVSSKKIRGIAEHSPAVRDYRQKSTQAGRHHAEHPYLESPASQQLGSAATDARTATLRGDRRMGRTRDFQKTFAERTRKTGGTGFGEGLTARLVSTARQARFAYQSFRSISPSGSCIRIFRPATSISVINSSATGT